MNDLRDSPFSIGLVRHAGRPVIAIVPLWLTASFVLTTTIPIELRMMVAIVAILSVGRPVEGLCVGAATAPLGHLIAIAMESSPIRFTEALAGACLAGWLARPTPACTRA